MGRAQHSHCPTRLQRTWSPLDAGPGSAGSNDAGSSDCPRSTSFCCGAARADAHRADADHRAG